MGCLGPWIITTYRVTYMLITLRHSAMFRASVSTSKTLLFPSSSSAALSGYVCMCVQYIYGDVLRLCGKVCHLSPSKMGSGGFGGWPSVASRRKVDGLQSLQVAPEQAHTVLTSTTFVIAMILTV